MVKTVYYTDDDRDDQALFEEAINELGHKVKLFDLVPVLMEHMKLPPPPDIVFLDLNMPNIDGMQALAMIRSDRRYDDTPVIIYSTSGHDHDVDQARIKGANLYIKKSTAYKDIKNAIAKALAIDWPNFTPKRKDFLMR